MNELNSCQARGVTSVSSPIQISSQITANFSVCFVVYRLGDTWEGLSLFSDVEIIRHREGFTAAERGSGRNLCSEKKDFSRSFEMTEGDRKWCPMHAVR